MPSERLLMIFAQIIMTKFFAVAEENSAKAIIQILFAGANGLLLYVASILNI